MATLEAIKYSRGKLLVLDQLRLPHENHYDEVSTCEEAFDCIRSMRVRGAPAIAIVAALAAAVELHNGRCTATTTEETIAYIDSRLDYLLESRPTAVDLSNAISSLKSTIRSSSSVPNASSADIIATFIARAESILTTDLETNRAIGRHGAAWLTAQLPDQQKLSVLTHCNTGSLATSGHGTALGIVRTLHAGGRLAHAYCTETRPYNQGSRLTAHELVFEGIPSTLITDSMAGALMALKQKQEQQGIAAVIVGADRVVRNGDTANKIGTYSLAVLARHHGVKFVVAAPTTSIDLATADGSGIHIEERRKEELTQISGAVVNPDGSVDASRTARVAIADQRVGVWNPAFDVTPAALIDSIVTEKGTVVKGPDGKFDLGKVKEA